MWRWLIVLAIGIVFTGFAAFCFVSAVESRREFERCLHEEQISAPFRLDEPGVIEGDIQVTCGREHGHAIDVLLPPSLVERLPSEDAVVLVDGRVEVRTADGRDVVTPGFMGMPVRDLQGRRCLRLWSDYLPYGGPYRVRVELARPNADLGPEPGRLVFVNQLCGCELLPAWFSRLFGYAAAILGLPLVLIGGMKTVQRGRGGRYA